ncbi:GGDEF domain-containing protein, partial [Streptomyces sp. NPDC055722]
MDVGELLTGIIRTLGLSALVVLGYSWVIRKFSEGLAKGAAVGVLFALGGIISMNDPIKLAPGVIYDGRTALLALAYPYGGPIGTIIALGAMAVYRVWIGGVGALSGVIGMAATALIGFACTLIPVRRLKIGPVRSLLIGTAASTSLAAILLLPHEIVVTLVGIPLVALIVANIVSVILVSEFLEREKSRQRIMRELEHEASVDPLTKLQNRRAFDQAALRAMNDNRSKSHQCSLMMIDIDHFKAINDRWGHDAGDMVLADVAAIIRKNVRTKDVVVRYGGEEMVLLLTNKPQSAAVKIAESVRSQIEQTQFETGDESLGVIISAGVASLSDRLRDIDSVVKALY